jgi:hypothetical protein
VSVAPQLERIYEPDLASEVSALLLLLSWKRAENEGAASRGLIRDAAVAETPGYHPPSSPLTDCTAAGGQE